MILRPLSPADWRLTSVKVRGERLPQTLAFIEKTWKRFTGGQPFQYSFLDKDFDALYESERRAGRLFSAFSILAVLVACLGPLRPRLLRGRTEDAGDRDRKTLGASTASLAGLLSREVLILVGIAAAVASPPAFAFAGTWLRSFAFRIPIHPLMFARDRGDGPGRRGPLHRLSSDPGGFGEPG